MNGKNVTKLCESLWSVVFMLEEFAGGVSQNKCMQLSTLTHTLL